MLLLIHQLHEHYNLLTLLTIVTIKGKLTDKLTTIASDVRIYKTKSLVTDHDH